LSIGVLDVLLIFRSIKLSALIAAILLTCTALTSASATSHLKISDLKREETVADWIADFDSLSESQIPNANGSIIGLFAQWFRRSPHRVEDWLMLPRSDAIKAQALVGLAMIGQREQAISLAQAHGVSAQSMWRSANFVGGTDWPYGGGTHSHADVVREIPSIDTMPIERAWEQDLMWLSAFVTHDNQYTHRILAAADRQFGLSAKGDKLAFAFVAAAIWSTKSNAAHFPFIADAVSEYETANPGSPVLVLLRSE
jgi:hypothetical protein